METVYIYGLIDPETHTLRYIGKAKNPERRYIEHLSIARRTKKRCYRDNWILSVLSKGLKPSLEIIEVCDDSNWQESERFWIEQAFEAGVKLTNISQGGRSGPSGDRHPFYGGGDKFTPEHRMRMSISAKNKPPITEETRRRRSRSHMGKTSPNKGVILSEDWRRKLSESTTGKPKTDNHNKKNSLAVTMMWSKRKGDIKRIYQLQTQYFELFGEYNRKYPTP